MRIGALGTNKNRQELENYFPDFSLFSQYTNSPTAGFVLRRSSNYFLSLTKISPSENDHEMCLTDQHGRPFLIFLLFFFFPIHRLTQVVVVYNEMIFMNWNGGFKIPVKPKKNMSERQCS